MKFIADFHIHSHFSLATSKELTPEYLDYWARIKGISLVATGDFTHPGWIAELKEKLIPAGNGFFKIRPDLRLKLPFQNKEVEDLEVFFILSAEISNIYKKKGKVRKVHNLLYAPDFGTVEKMQYELGKIGNITSDGRPILGLDSHDLLDLALNVSQDIFFVPAHIWTPWFSVLGEKSGFDCVEDCFEDLTDHIHAVETGLSTDPALNWMCSFLDRFTLLSNSDAHSPDRLGRNANRFDCEMDYSSVIDAIKQRDGKTFLGTIDMYPQEGKYHYDGHRKCGVCWNPVETLRNRAICPSCGKRVVVGVASRIAQISDRTDITQRPGLCGFQSIIPLPEILSEIYNSGESSKKVKQAYFSMIQKMGSEFDILLHHDTETIERKGGAVLAEAVSRMRDGRILIQEGYDGEYGIIKVFRNGEAALYETGEKLFLNEPAEKYELPGRRLLNFDLQEYRILKEQNYVFEEAQEEGKAPDWLSSFNQEQKEAVMHRESPALVLAGPGTGKTRVLTSRIACLINQYSADPGSILALTFTNKAAGEIKERLSKSMDKEVLEKITVSTFHSLGLQILKENYASTGRDADFLLAGEDEKRFILQQITDLKDQRNLAEKITSIKQNLLTEKDISDRDEKNLFLLYQQKLLENNCYDLEDLVYIPYQLLHSDPALRKQYADRFRWILIDEYQDINHSQYFLVRELLDSNHNIFAIGDPNQAIYGFRGSDIAFIRRFKEDFSNSKMYQLKKSYRCTDRILQASTCVLNFQAEENLKGTAKGLKLRIDTHPDDRAEALFIARTIDELMGGLQFHSMDKGLKTEEDSVSLSDFAVLCRTRAQMEIIGTIFTEKNIPCQLTSRESVYSRDPFKTVLDLLSDLCTGNQMSHSMLSARNVDSVKMERPDLSSVKSALSGIIDHFSELSEDKYMFQVQSLLALADSFGDDVPAFLRHIRLGTGVDSWEAKAEKVSVMTIHASKGLEFPCVFIPGCEDGILPYSLYFERPDEEEEKRLLYVAMTRASKYLYLSHALKRRIHGRDLHLPRSPFLNAIEQNLFEVSFKEKKKEDTQLKLF